ncbi:4-hydroxy-tetrahydrodipicolinate reductase [Methylophilus medardicus]|uniref:4-hydroxy-tetrahydrodipicolinate reductase n=1 Tax=Methylophilus medardicus TaxID=2588534 RepID=A0A5B8CT91_9PROT|nr:4-hydroxy-tetrahydrodipicolinate reductase [Methylophilus medardicus]QDC44503.1 4-hydroxy-tetrahydrodipicolinate reductase [Methylophilus medardicus]QDC49510.1 4-hydroxy-tetrahydrodipicolinate reductase [Methylophilus medardicus]QDC53215.1 4-hydroxy-tetrahydrodipicolinate reductase [Methylophilus medardicus]
MLKVVIAGVSGRMGHALLEGVFSDNSLQLHAALDRPESAMIGRDAGEQFGKQTGVKISADVVAALQGADVLVDFTRPEPSMQYLQACQAAKVSLVIGTTGFSDAEKATIAQAAQEISIVFAPNMSVGVTLLINLVEQAARVLNQGYDIEVVEMHHRHKVDAPSGTALRLGEAAAKGIEKSLNECAVYAREGVTGEREAGTIGFATMRGGDVVGDHTVVLAGIGERVELTHKASSRATFAQGALRAAKFLADKPQGLFDMRDVLGFDKT